MSGRDPRAPHLWKGDSPFWGVPSVSIQPLIPSLLLLGSPHLYSLSTSYGVDTLGVTMANQTDGVPALLRPPVGRSTWWMSRWFLVPVFSPIPAPLPTGGSAVFHLPDEETEAPQGGDALAPAESGRGLRVRGRPARGSRRPRGQPAFSEESPEGRLLSAPLSPPKRFQAWASVSRWKSQPGSWCLGKGRALKITHSARPAAAAGAW